MHTREETQAIRTANLLGIIGGVGVFAMMKWGLPNMSAGRPYHSLFWGSQEHWPPFVKSFAPLDLAFTCFYLWVVMRLTVLAMPSPGRPGATNWLYYIAGVFCGMGAFGGAMSAPMFGWYRSIEFFIAMGAGSVAFIGAMALMCYCVFGIGLGFRDLGYAAWQRIKFKKVAQPLARFGRYMKADDVQEE